MHTLSFNVVIPDWVTYVAQDADGTWYGYDNKPRYMKEEGQGWVFLPAVGRRTMVDFLCKSPCPVNARTTLFGAIRNET